MAVFADTTGWREGVFLPITGTWHVQIPGMEGWGYLPVRGMDGWMDGYLTVPN